MLTGDMDKFGSALDANPLTKEETEERIRKTQAITEKMAQTWRMFAITLEPVVRGLHNIMDALFKANKVSRGWLGIGLLVISATYAFIKAAAAAKVAVLAFQVTMTGLGLTLKSVGGHLALLAALVGVFQKLPIGPVAKFTIALVALALAAYLAVTAMSGPGAAATGGTIMMTWASGLAMLGTGALISLGIGETGDSPTTEVAGFPTPDDKRAAGGPAKGGLTLVGEEGPELIVLPAMANVINNDNFTEVFRRYDSPGETGQDLAKVVAPPPVEAEGFEPIAQPPMTNIFNSPIFVDVIAETQQVKQPEQKPVEQLPPPPPPPPQKSGDTTVVIKIGNQEMGRAVIKAIESVPGYNLRGLPRGA
jgi:hypothetical protein